MINELEAHLEEHDGTATVAELATITGESEGFVRAWARQNEVRRCGSTFVFGRDAVLDFVEDLEAIDDEAGEADGDDDAEDDEDG